MGPFKHGSLHFLLTVKARSCN